VVRREEEELRSPRRFEKLLDENKGKKGMKPGGGCRIRKEIVFGEGGGGSGKKGGDDPRIKTKSKRSTEKAELGSISGNNYWGHPEGDETGRRRERMWGDGGAEKVER